MVGAPDYSNALGAAWVFTRSGGVWTQQELIAASAFGNAQFGWSVALSGDGNTAVLGGRTGVAWVYTRNGGVWTQQGSQLVGTGAVKGDLGYSVALSADGNTAILGGPDDNNALGAAWIFTRSDGVWTQQGPKLVGTGAAGGTVYQGYSVGLSGDGTTAIVGGPHDNSGVGAAWIFTRGADAWIQQGGKLVGTGADGTANQGWSVALSADGDIAMVGGPYDTQFLGATWVHTRRNGVWTQQGSKLVGTGAVGNANQGWSVALSSDGNTAILGGNADNSDIGAAWGFVQRTKEDCKNGGWLNFPTPPGPFTSQGQCVSYFAAQP
jgi:hypothetical protein